MTRRDVLQTALMAADFQTDQEEAQWWDDHQDLLSEAFEEAAKDGTLGRGTMAKRGLVET